MHYFLSIDCGLTDCKAVLFDQTGKPLYQSSHHTPRDGNIIDTVDMREVIISLVRDIVHNAGVDPEEILTVSTSGHGNGLYLIGEEGLLSFGFSSMYGESKKQTPKTDETFHFTLQTSWCGQPLPILAFLREEKPAIFEQIRKILFCKDVIKYFLTGDVSTDYTDASAAGLLNYANSEYDEELMAKYGLGDCMHLLPRICNCTDVVGHITKEFSSLTGLSEKTKVLGGLFDVNACMLGSGVIDRERYCIIAGTWGINSLVTKRPVPLPSVTQCCCFALPQKFILIDSAPTSCTNLEWFTKNVLGDLSYREADEIVASQPFDPELLYLPYLYKPMEMEIGGGAFLGMDYRNTHRDMLRSVFEGIVFDHTMRINKLRKAGFVCDKAVLTGGAANSEVFCRIFADCTGLDIYTTACAQTGALGGAILGAVASGIYPDIETAVGEMVQIKAHYAPENPEQYTEKFAYFEKAINLFNHKL